jgi:ParB-like chromosome segregation protein Spo0J
VAQVAASIVEFGWTSPILIGTDGVIIAGHARLLAARKLGMDEVPVIVLDHLTEAQRRALVLADNKLAMNAGWDDAMLRIELQDLEVGGFNLGLIGFSDEELVVLLAGDQPDGLDAAAEDDVPEPPAQPVTQPGDVFLSSRQALRRRRLALYQQQPDSYLIETTARYCAPAPPRSQTWTISPCGSITSIVSGFTS